MKKRKEPPMEPAVCIGCGKEFQRIATANRKRQFCDRPKCQAIKRIKNSVAKLSDINTGKPSKFGEIIRYHGDSFH